MMTGAGMILGTAAYMSPEQARGKTVDKRADIWAFGCVLYEMLTGQRVFIGETMSDTLASVLKTDPNWRALPGAAPAGLRRLLRRCLEKDPKRRLQAIGEARVQIEDLLAGAPDGTDAIVMAAASPRWRRPLPWVLGALVVGGLAAALLLGRAPPAPAGRPARFVITTPPDAPFRSGTQPAVTISPDGSRVVYRSARDADPIVTGLLYVRALDRFEAVPLRGSDGALSAAFSRDGRWIVYHDVHDGVLKRVSALGGSPVTICSLDGATLRGASWGPDDTIVFATERSKGLMRVPAAGGKPERLTMVDPSQGRTGPFLARCIAGRACRALHVVGRVAGASADRGGLSAKRRRAPSARRHEPALLADGPPPVRRGRPYAARRGLRRPSIAGDGQPRHRGGTRGH